MYSKATRRFPNYKQIKCDIIVNKNEEAPTLVNVLNPSSIGLYPVQRHRLPRKEQNQHFRELNVKYDGRTTRKSVALNVLAECVDPQL